MQSLRVGISPVLEMSQHVGVCRYSPLHFITTAKAARVAFPPRIKITRLPRSRYFSVFVIFGVSKREYRSYKTWQENNKVPTFVLELTSKSSKKQDEETNPLLYSQLGIQEYFQYDPTDDYLKPQLKGQSLVNGIYQPIAPQTLTDGSITIASQVLAVELKLLPALATSLLPSSIGPLNRELRFIDPSTDTQLLTYEESERFPYRKALPTRLQAEQKVSEAQHRVEQAKQQAEEER